MNAPLFSIVIPCLNSGEFLERALLSVLQQAGDYTEVIVVDGGSTDSSVEIIQKHQAQLAWWCSESDSGQSAALNKGFQHASGKFLLWLNADDILLPGVLQRCYDYLMQNPECQWLTGNLIYINSEDSILWCARDEAWHDALYRNAPVRVYGPSSIFHRELLQSAGGLDESLHYVMDTDLWLRFKAIGARFHKLPDYFWGFRVHGGSKTASDLKGQPSAPMVEERERMYLKHDFTVTRRGLFQQRLWRVLCGAYLRAYVDTLRWKGKSVGKF